MKAICQGRYEPITKCVGFLDCDVDKLVAALAQWQGRIARRRLDAVRIASVRGTVADAFSALQPLSAGKSRFLLVPTKSKWVACFDNYHLGPDVAGEMGYLCDKLSIVGVRALLAEAPWYQYPACMLGLMGPRTETRPSSYIRSITAANDGGNWIFDARGEQQSFETPEYYDRVKPQDRFTAEILEEYLLKLDIRMFDESYFCWNESQLVSRWGIGNLFEQRIPLAKVRKKIGLPEFPR